MSVSITGLGDDPRITAAHAKAVDAAMEWLSNATPADVHHEAYMAGQAEPKSVLAVWGGDVAAPGLVGPLSRDEFTKALVGQFKSQVSSQDANVHTHVLVLNHL